MKTKLTLVIMTIAFLSGCGDSSNSEVEKPEEVVITPAPSVCDYIFEKGLEEDNEFITNEYCNTPGLALIKTSSAYLAGATGAGVKIAVMDSGINKKSMELSGKTLNGVSFVAEYANADRTAVYIDESYALGFDQIESFEIINKGFGYISAPSLTLEGDGSGANAYGILGNLTYGDADQISIIGTEQGSYGSGFTYGTVLVDNSGTDGEGLEVGKVRLGGDDVFGHGSFISGIIGANKEQTERNVATSSIQGIAFNSEIVTVKTTYNSNGNFLYYATNQGFRYIIDNNISIVNMSYGGGNTEPDYRIGIMEEAVTKGISLIIAAGNNGYSMLRDENGSIYTGEQTFPAGTPALDGYSHLTQQEGAWVVVGAVDENKNIAHFSNRAGYNKEYYLVAQGMDLISISPDKTDTYMLGQGTSYATPFVVGAFALMKEKYPQLTGKEIANIYFETAEDLGEPGTDEIYGRGLIDIKAAFELAEQRASAL